MPRWFGRRSEVSATCQLKLVVAPSICCKEGSSSAVLLLCINESASMMCNTNAGKGKRESRCNDRVVRGDV